MSREEKKIEASIPVQARVNIMSLANLNTYWNEEGYQIKTMSQLLGFSIDLLCEILRANQKFEREIITVAEANNYLERSGLYQASMKDRTFKKLGKAIMFENMRAEGTDPRVYTPRTYHSIHRGPDEQSNPSTVEPFIGRVDSEQIKQALEIASGLDEEELMKRITEREHEAPERSATDNRVVRREDAAGISNRIKPESELSPLSEKKNSKASIEAHIREADERSMAEMDALRNLDLSTLHPVKGD